jgi:serine/threonine protein kinase
MALDNITINGRFRVERKLGEGSQAEVYKVRDLNDGI